VIYLNIETINPGLYRVSAYVDMSGLLRFFHMLRGKPVGVNQTVVEHGHAKTKTATIDEILAA
jgi:hypothetical protein